MSRTTLYKVPESGPLSVFREFGNSWRSGAYVWSVLVPKYLGMEIGEFMWQAEKHGDRLWNLYKDRRLPRHERAALLFTFDRSMIRRAEFAEMARLLEEFAAANPTPNSLGEQAQALRELAEVPDAFAACWNQTSVVSNWTVRDGDIEDDAPSRYYDLSRDTGHVWIFDELDLDEAAVEARKLG